MKYLTGEKVELLDTVRTVLGVEGTVVGFDKVNERDFVQLRSGTSTLWASANSITKISN